MTVRTEGSEVPKSESFDFELETARKQVEEYFENQGLTVREVLDDLHEKTVALDAKGSPTRGTVIVRSARLPDSRLSYQDQRNAKMLNRVARLRRKKAWDALIERLNSRTAE